LNFNTVCDDLPGRDGYGQGAQETAALRRYTFTDDVPLYSSAPLGYTTECPAPKAALRLGDLKILAECFDGASLSFMGRVELYNISADASEQTDLAPERPEDVARLQGRLREFGLEATRVAPLGDEPPWQGADYFCAACPKGSPQGTEQVWMPWCEGPGGEPCGEVARERRH